MELSSKASDSSLCYPDFSLVIEWENVLHTEQEIPQKMLHRIFEQISLISDNLKLKPEVIIVYDPSKVKKHQIEQIVEGQIAGFSTLIDLQIISAPSCHYYQQKNVGAKHCSNGITIFFDSDCMPDDGWLIGILESFNRPDVSVVSGHTYMPLNTLMEKAFALFWYFPPETYREDVFCEKNFFFANNVAFLTNIFQVHNFAELPQLRGHCVALANRLKHYNIKIFYQPNARASHPPPNGFMHFVNRGLQMGHDKARAIMRERQLDSGTLNTVGRSAEKTSLHKILSNIRQKYRYVNPNAFEILPVFVIPLVYYTLGAIGLLVTLVKPDFLYNRLSV